MSLGQSIQGLKPRIGTERCNSIFERKAKHNIYTFSDNPKRRLPESCSAVNWISF